MEKIEEMEIEQIIMEFKKLHERKKGNEEK